MIALGLSLLFGLGWAVGLLASSDLPEEVRYPAEWIFTLATAFLGVYLFLLYVIRSSEARILWKRWLCCQCKKTVDLSRSGARGTWSSTLRSWAGTLKRSKKADINTNTLTCRANSASANIYSVSNPSAGMAHMESCYADPSSMMKKLAAGITSPTSLPVEFELVQFDPDGQSNNEATLQTVTPSQLPVNLDLQTESIVETMDFEDNFSLLSFNAPSFQSNSSESRVDADCYISKNKETEGADYIPI